MSKRKARKQRTITRPSRRRVKLALGVLLAALLTGGALAQFSTLWPASQKDTINLNLQEAPNNLTPASLSKEYIYAGNRLIATEEPNSIAPKSQSFAANGGIGSITVSAGVNWTASSGASAGWITGVTTSGSGNGTVNYTVQANTGADIRSGTITVTIGGQPHAFTVYQGKDFNDVLSGHPYYIEIGKIAARQVTLGCSTTPPNFCPDAVVTREQMAAFIIRALGDPNPPPPPAQRFVDVPPSNIFYAFIEQMAVRQITLGCPAPNYCPAANVTHEQMAAFISRALGVFNPTAPPESQRTFKDVCAANIFYAFIEYYAGGAGGRPVIWPGCAGTGTACASLPNCGDPGYVPGRCFCPGDGVTRAQMAYILVKAFNL